MLKRLVVVDEFTRECLAIRVKRKLSSMDVIDVLKAVTLPDPFRRQLKALACEPSRDAAALTDAALKFRADFRDALRTAR